MALFDVIGSELPKWVTGVRVDTEWLPPIIIADPFATTPGPVAPNPVLSVLKPRLTFEIKGGALNPLRTAPYGEPGPTRWPQLKTGLTIAGVAALLLLVAARRRRR